MANLSSGLIGLSMLSGSSSYLDLFSSANVESAAVIRARQAFTTPETTPPWQQAASRLSFSSQVTAIRKMATIIDTSWSSTLDALPDVQTAFTTYKALDRLRLLAEAAAKAGATSTDRTALQKAFANGLEDLQSFLGSAETDALNIAFSRPTRSVKSVGITPVSTGKTVGEGVVETRSAAIPGLSGSEVLKIDLSRSTGASDSVTIDLSQGTQPPTLDSVAAQINAAIAGIPLRDANGDPVTDANGNVISRWMSRVAVEKHGDSWGLTFSTAGTEKLAIDEVGAKDALMVVSGLTGLDAPAAAQMFRFDDPAGANTRVTLGSITAVDLAATEQARQSAASKPVIGDVTPTPPTVFAATTTRAITTDAQGFSYVVGTTAGDLGSNLSDGGNDLFLTKVDSEGKVVWQRTLGVAGEAEGAAISIAPNGEIVVAGTVKGPFNGSLGSDSDMLVARFDADGDELSATAVRSLGNDSATAVTVGADGAIYVGGKSATGGGDAFVARLDATGKVQERRTIDSGGIDTVTALAIDGSGELLALTRENGSATLRRLDGGALATDLGQLNLGAVDARAIAVSATGEIAVAGATTGAVAGTQVNAISGGRDGFVTRIDAALGSASTTYIGSADDDQVDSVAFMNGNLYVGGRTAGALDGARTGALDGFVARLDTASGAVADINQFGRSAHRAEPVRVAAASGGAGTALGALGLHRGQINTGNSVTLTAQTTLRAGDEFSIRLGDGKTRKITIAADDTLATLADKIRKITGSKAAITTPKLSGQSMLQITAKEGYPVELVAGAEGKDALAKLGLTPGKLIAVAAPGPDDPKVRPGGNYGLQLTTALNLNSATDAKAALKTITEAISMTQTAYRSLYWDSSKAALVDGTISGGGSAYQQAQLANYQAALDRLVGSTG